MTIEQLEDAMALARLACEHAEKGDMFEAEFALDQPQ